MNPGLTEKGLEELTTEAIKGMSRAELEEIILNLAQLAVTDYRTGLLNTRGFYSQLEPLVSAYKRHDGKLAVVYFDISRLGWVNDNMGHDKGDELIRRAANLIKGNIRIEDYAARVGGDEFIIILPQTDAKGAQAVVARIKAAADEDMLFQTYKSTVNYGIAGMEEVMPKELTGTSSPKHVIAKLAHDLVKLADMRMEKEKRAYYQTTGIKRRKK